MTKHIPDLDNKPFADQTTRRAYVQKWIARQQRKLAAGFGGTVLMLPLLAQAQTAEMVDASTLNGVRSVQVNPDGSAQITLSNGQVVRVAAAEVQVAADGTVLITSAAAELVAELALAAGTGVAGLGAGAIAGLGVAGLLVAAGTGGSSDSAPAILVLNDSLFSGASPTTAGDIFGQFPELESDVRVFITIGEDGDEFEVTIGEGGMTTFPSSLDLTGLQGLQSISFRVQGGVEVPVLDEDGEPVLDEDGNPVTKIEQQDIAEGSTQVFIDTIPPVLTITTPIAGDDVINAAEQGESLTIEGTAEGAEDGQVITVTFNGEDYTATVMGGAWSLTIPAADLDGLADDASLDITANVSDAAGNAADEATATVTTDFTAELTLNEVVIETINTFTGVEVTGSTTGVEEGRTVTVTFNGEPYTTTTGADRMWSVDIPTAVIDALDDGADVAISASVTDEAGNPASANASSTTDFSSPALAITSLATGSFLNATTIAEDLEVSGSAIAGSEVTVTLPGGIIQTATAGEDNTWSVTFGANDLPAEEGPLPINATTELGDATINAPTVTLTIDTTPPNIAITTPIAGDDVINATERETDLTVSGTTDAEDGQVVTVTFDGNDYTANVTSGAWSVTIPASALTGLDDDDSYTLSAMVSDQAGNDAVTPATAEVTTDFTPPEVDIIAFAGIAANSELTAADLLDDDNNALDNLELTGTTDAPDGTQITVSFGSETLTTTATGGAWSLNIPTSTVTAQLSGQSSVSIGAAATDAAGNIGTGTLPLTVDLSVPSIALSSPAGGTVLGLEAFEGGLSVAGTTENVENGQTVTIELRDSGSVVATTTGTVTNGAFTGIFAAAAIQGLDDQSDFTLGVSVTDPSFPIPATASVAVSTDIPPQITVDPIGEDGALIIGDLGDTITLSGTTRGVQAGQEVEIRDADDPTFLIATASVQADGSWSVAVDSPDDLEAGDVRSASFTVANSSAREVSVTETFVGYEAADYILTGATPVTAGPAAGALEFTFFLDPRTELPGDFGIAFGEALSFNTDVASYVAVPAPQFITGVTPAVNTDNLATGEVIFGGVGFLNPTDAETGEPIDLYSERLIRFRLNHDDTDADIILTVDSQVGGDYAFVYGSDAATTITAGNIDTVIRGGGGDDNIDVSAAGINTIIFEGGSIANGFDTITGFTLGGALSDRFGIAFDTFSQDNLRGEGTDFQVTSGGALGADVGLVVFTTAVADFAEATIEAALGGLTGLSNGDSFFVMIGDGTDAVLTTGAVTGGVVSISTDSDNPYARFEDIGDLSGFSSSNVLGFEQHNA